MKLSRQSCRHPSKCAMPIYPYKGIWPKIAASAFVAPTANVIGDVEIGEYASVWYGAVLRGDVMPIRVGARTSIQDNAVMHATGGWRDCTIGEGCTVGHSVILHGCTVGNGVLVGMGSVVLDAAVIGDNTLLGAGSLVTARAQIPSGVLAHGRPAKVARPLTSEDLAIIAESARLYVGYGAEHRASLQAADTAQGVR